MTRIKAKMDDNFFQTSDNLSLYFKSTPAIVSKASVIFVHGVGEHIERYDDIFNAFAHHGYSCFGFDQRGFGRSEGEPGHVDFFSEYIEDLAKFIEKLGIKKTETPVFLFGHSMGSIVALSYTLRYPSTFRGLMIFSCPLILANWFIDKGGYVTDILSIFSPRFKIQNRINPKELSDDPTVIKAFINDPLIVNKVSVKWIREFKLASQHILVNAQRINVAALICHGKEDHIAAVYGSKLLYEKLGGDDKSLLIFDGLKHELLNHRPAERLTVLKKAFGWLDGHC